MQRSLADWLSHLEQRHAKEIQLGLERAEKVAKQLDLLTPMAKVIIVGGTNGKGSTLAALEALYCAQGYQVATYTSPHLLVFNERIRLNKKNITDSDLVKAFTAIEAVPGSCDLTYFEMTTLAALWHFKQFSLDLILLEVGLGGRLDATNILSAKLAIITTIALDHEAYLGHTKEAIAYEKAGILRQNQNFIFADRDLPLSLKKEAKRLNTTNYFLGTAYDFESKEGSFLFQSGQEKIVLKESRLHAHALGAALMASICLKRDLPLAPRAYEALNHLSLQGRVQFLKVNHIETLMDVSHNPQATLYLANHLKKRAQKGRIYAVFSALADKNISALLAPLLNLVHHWYLALLDNKRAASQAQLEAPFQKLSKDCPVLTLCADPVLAYQRALEKAKANDLILVFGSFFTVSQVLAYVSNGEQRLEEISEHVFI